MAEKVTTMVLKVIDLQCPCCYKKVKKILCKFPEIRNQVYDEKANTVTITVVCCNPEKIRDKLCCKGSKVIISIEIKEPQKTEEKKKDPKPASPKPDPKPASPKPDPKPPAPTPSSPPCQTGPGIVLVDGCPPNFLVPVRTCCGPCSEGYGGGPCYHGHGFPPPPPPCYDGCYGYGYGQRGWYNIRCDYYLCEDRVCSIM